MFGVSARAARRGVEAVGYAGTPRASAASTARTLGPAGTIHRLAWRPGGGTRPSYDTGDAEGELSDAAEGGRLVLQLYELRTEPALRRARAWFAFEFHPATARDVLAAWLGPGHASAPYRMVTTYWEMAAALVAHGALDPALFHAANTEHVAVYAKLRPHLAEVRAASGDRAYLASLEQVVLGMPDVEARLAVIEQYLARQARYAAEGRQVAPETAESPGEDGAERSEA